jgi:hypothetical protein
MHARSDAPLRPSGFHCAARLRELVERGVHEEIFLKSEKSEAGQEASQADGRRSRFLRSTFVLRIECRVPGCGTVLQ